MMRRLFLTRESALLLVLVLLVTTFGMTVDGFLDSYNLFERTRYWAAPGLIAITMTFIIATGGIDLSVGSIVALGGVVMGLLYRDLGWSIWAASGAALLVGVAAGTFNGLISGYLKVPPLVVTLATMALYRGVAMGLSHARPVTDFPAAFLWLGQGGLFAVPGTGPAAVPFPVPLLSLAAGFAVGWVVMRRTWVGRFAELMGENSTAARFAAISVPRLTCALYAGSGLLCGLGSLFHTALYATAKADAARGMELEVVACVVIGGTAISGGRGSMTGSLLGLLIVGILRFGLEMAGVKSQNVVIVMGGVLIAAAVFNEWIASKKNGE